MCENNDNLFGIRMVNNKNEKSSNDFENLIDKFEDLFEYTGNESWLDYVVEYVLNLKK